jgi:hypothetical protein
LGPGVAGVGVAGDRLTDHVAGNSPLPAIGPPAS